MLTQIGQNLCACVHPFENRCDATIENAWVINVIPLNDMMDYMGG